jgi:hypothetical protein
LINTIVSSKYLYVPGLERYIDTPFFFFFFFFFCVVRLIHLIADDENPTQQNQTTNTHPKAGKGPIDPSERGDRSGATIIN